VDDDPSVSEENLIAQREELGDKARIRQYTSATAFKRDRGGDDRPGRDDDTEPWSRGRAMTRLGRAVHATIQSLPLDAGIELAGPFSQAQAVAEAIPHLKDEVERLVSWIITESPAWKRAREAGRVLREVPFAIANGDRILEGFIDMVIETPDGLEIVDWKTDRITEREIEDRLQKYRMQAGLYVYGLEGATGREVSRVTYVFASPEREVSPGDPRDLAREARSELLSSDAPV
jgi:ATP-dependent helicase/nuclease subunit A